MREKQVCTRYVATDCYSRLTRRINTVSYIKMGADKIFKLADNLETANVEMAQRTDLERCTQIELGKRHHLWNKSIRRWQETRRLYMGAEVELVHMKSRQKIRRDCCKPTTDCCSL